MTQEHIDELNRLNKEFSSVLNKIADLDSSLEDARIELTKINDKIEELMGVLEDAISEAESELQTKDAEQE